MSVNPKCLQFLPLNYLRMIEPPGDPAVPRGVTNTLYNPADIFAPTDSGEGDRTILSTYVALTHVQFDLIHNRVREWSLSGTCRQPNPDFPGEAQVNTFTKSLGTLIGDEVDLQNDYAALVGFYSYETPTLINRGYALQPISPLGSDPDVLSVDYDGSTITTGNGNVFLRFAEYAYGSDPADPSVNGWHPGSSGIRDGYIELDICILGMDWQHPVSLGRPTVSIADTILASRSAPVVNGTGPSDLAIYGQLGYGTTPLGTVTIDGIPYDYDFILSPSLWWEYNGTYDPTTGLPI